MRFPFELVTCAFRFRQVASMVSLNPLHLAEETPPSRGRFLLGEELIELRHLDVELTDQAANDGLALACLG